MAIKGFSASLLVGLAGVFLVVAPGLLSQAKATNDILEGPASNQTMADQEIEDLIMQNKRNRGSAQRNACSDKYSQCPAWASAGFCQQYYVDWMATNCPKACNKCPCTNQYSQCDAWASSGYCTRYYVNFMQTYCKKACNVCSSCKCGQANRGNSNNKIVGGVDTEKNEYPWQVLLIDQNSRLFCGGSIISKKEILTAAHCTQGKVAAAIRVLVGDHNIHQNDGQKVFQVCNIKEHESYNSNTVDYDFAILRLCNEIEFSEDISPACLPEVSGQDPGLNEGVDTIVSGWGLVSDTGNHPSILQEITMRTMNNAVCATTIAGLIRNPLTDRMLCGQANGKSVCRGDSGGPWVTKDGSNYILTGVSSWAPKDRTTDAHCVPGVPSVAARVSNQLAWIKNNMQSATCPRA